MSPLLNTKAIGILTVLQAMFILVVTQNASAETTEALRCTPEYQIIKTLPNSAKWEMCWEPRVGYGYRLSQVIYTPPNGIRRKVLESLHAAQLFVPYDDNGARYHDITYGRNLAVLTAADCPSGVLLTNSTLCLMNRPTGFFQKNVSAGISSQGNSFALYGYFGIGQYYYTFQYTFLDDGSIEPAVGASGSLQRYAGTLATGSPINSQIAVNHNHLVIWRMDFDIDGTANNLVERIDFAGQGSDQRDMTVTPLTTETKETNNLINSTFWRVRNTAQNNLDGRSVSYEIEPNVTDQLRAPETFTQSDFYLTQYKAAEELVDSGLVNYVNGETLTDAVLWYGVNFHHVPRGEDDVRMPAHWQGFKIRPRDMTAIADATSANNPPVFSSTPGAQSTKVNTAVNMPVSATDPDGDTLQYSATGLPTGLAINSSTGLISGTATVVGNYNVNLSVSDGHPGGIASATFNWAVTAAVVQQVQTFTAPALITIRDYTTASPYPAAINVSGLSGAISKVVVKLIGLTHTYPQDIDMLLVGPAGQKVMLMSDTGGTVKVSNINVTFDSSAAGISASTVKTGTYKPTDNSLGSVDRFVAPAPVAPYPTDLNVFNGASANGTWKLFIVDDAARDVGQIANGYSLTITTQ